MEINPQHGSSEQFTNETINVRSIPRFEEVVFTPLHPNYWKETLILLAFVFVVIGLGLGIFMCFNDATDAYDYLFIAAYVLVMGISVFFSRISFTKKGFAFREHDVLFRDGMISTHTMIIPYNRVQHVALHEGAIARLFGLAKVEVFTAGGYNSDIEIPGIEKEQAENIKQLLMGKIHKEL